ncbi:Uma2 family endonuclease [Nocardia sp. BMG51109]|uniref:Uma2 family endonuclease n=1 Tax=Nocardia sp. BMG51109 TaxID=1056816 RepID=UPI000466FF54|nr:Uma2 family endonuclease [Nocardia sp. BMG51109]
MSGPHIERPDLPEYMSWEELERLPEEIADQIELWNGRVVWMRRGSGEHQMFIRRLTNALEQSTRKDMSTRPDHCWVANFETNIFFGATGKSDFATPDFLVHRCLGGPYRDIRSSDVLLVGEVLSPSNTPVDVEAKKGRYADAGIPWYWEVHLERDDSAIDMVRALALETRPGQLPDGVRPLHRANYLAVGEWTRADTGGIAIDHPFPIHIPWSELEF